jgi:hypothetical protein
MIERMKTRLMRKCLIEIGISWISQLKKRKKLRTIVRVGMLKMESAVKMKVKKSKKLRKNKKCKKNKRLKT